MCMFLEETSVSVSDVRLIAHSDVDDDQITKAPEPRKTRGLGAYE